MKINTPFTLDGVKELCIDVETYGLKFEDNLFSVQISTDKGQDYYFNLKDYPCSPWLKPITPEQLKRFLSPLHTYKGIIYGANLGYDLQKLALMDIRFPEATLLCTHTMEKTLNPEDMPKLERYAPRYGQEKLDIVEKYIKENDLYDPKSTYMGVTIPKKPRYDLVPWSQMSKYAMVDAQITLKIGQVQKKQLEKHLLLPVIAWNTKALNTIQNFGIRLDTDYCKERFKHHKDTCFDILDRQKEGFSDGKLYLTKLFKEKNIPLTINRETNEPIFNSDVLSQYTHIQEIEDLLKYREHYKLYRSFYFNLLYYSHKDRLHVSLNPYGTNTSRFSTSKPALQTLPRDNKEVKRALVPDEGCFFLEMDYSAMEVRLAMDLSGEKKAITSIKNGLDLHQQTANMVGCSRTQAKTVVFSKLYGSGIKRIASQTGLSYEKAKEIYYSIDKAYPSLNLLNKKLQAQATQHGFIKNRYGRLLHIPKNKAYKALNYYVQSTGADVMRIAIAGNDRFIKQNNLKSRIVLAVHDSLLMQIPFSEHTHQQKFKDLMEQAYASKYGLSMKVDADHSLKSYGDMEKGFYPNT